MAPIKINSTIIKELSEPNLITYTSDRIANMTSNVHFPVLSPTITDANKILEDFIGARALAKQVPSTENKQDKELKYGLMINLHLSWITIIEETPDLTLEMVATTHYTPYATRTPAELPPPAGKPSFKPGVNTGEAILMAVPYKQEKKKINYNWQVSEDQGATWQRLPSTGSHRKKVNGLELCKEYWFRVAYATTAGEGEFSDYVVVTLSADSKAKPKQSNLAALKQAA